MRVLVTGATGFVGTHVVRELLARNCDVVATAKEAGEAEGCEWIDDVDFVPCDLSGGCGPGSALRGDVDALIHLAWGGLPDYRGLLHLEQNLPMSYAFVKAMLEAGLRRLVAVGTCLEYGLRNGCLHEDVDPRPVTAYGLAKDTLRRSIDVLATVHDFRFSWVRLFYMYGPGQHPNSLLSQLDAALARGERTFDMSGGEQLRDYLPVSKVAEYLVSVALHPRATGIVNCCSGRPISVRRLVEEHVASRGAAIQLNLGHYPYPDYEPMAFWGDRRRLEAILGRQEA